MSLDCVHTLSGYRERRADWAGSVGFVPTMGALHEGHASLIRRARAECGHVVVSVFVNPLQFGPNEDFDRYPRTLDADCEIAAEAGADLVFAPDAGEMYPAGFQTTVSVGPLAERLCGLNRPGHFDGVTTVVCRLFGMVAPDRAYFGQKDFQQVAVIRRMVADLVLPVEVVSCPIVREADGLAMSSRNALLPEEHRRLAPRFHEILAGGGTDEEMAAQLAAAGFEVDYVARRDGRILGAVRIGNVRLIDNVER